MSKQKLPPEHTFQKEDDDNCGPSCLSMVYKFKGKSYGVDKIVKDFHLGKKGMVTYLPQLARHLNKNGIKTKLYMSSPRIVSPAWANFDRAQLIEAIKEWTVLHPDEGWQLYGLHIAYYLQEGGTFELKSYNLGDFKRILDSGSMMILCVDEVWLWGHRFNAYKAEIDDYKGKTYGHYVLVTDYLDNKFTVYDPYPTKLKSKHGVYQVDGYQLLNSSLIWAATILEIIK